MFSIVAVFLLAPFLENVIVVFPVTNMLLFAVIILTFRIMGVPRSGYIAVICLGSAAVSLEYLIGRGSISPANNTALIMLLSMYVLFIGATIVFLIKSVFAEKNITTDTVKGGISIYLLMGFWWIFLYSLVLAVNPGAMISTAGENLDLVRLYRFSFATLTTVGYGEIYPKSELAITLSNFEAVAGQIYLTVFIARLVGMRILSKIKK